MRHHRHNPDFEFVVPPVEFTKNTEKACLQYCLGGVLYMPGTKNIIDSILQGNPPAPSMVMCFEDAIQKEAIEEAENNVLNHLHKLATAYQAGDISLADIPLIFLRVRNLGQFKRFSSRLNPEQASVLSGFVFPKFYSRNALDYLKHLVSVGEKLDVRLYGMPVLEGPDIAFLETRKKELSELKEKMAPYREMILNVRVGGTDFSSLFAVRRDINTSIYNIMVVRDCLADVLNFFNRERDGYIVSAPVWEYFLAYKKEDLNRLLARSDRHFSLMKRNEIINDAVDGLLREVLMDRVNGFIGKTIIHPSHLRFVNGMHAVTREEYEDAQQILETSGGIVKSEKANKMNEINPHRSWANKITQRAIAYGVIEDDFSYLPLILGGK
jgi:citrate lyase beta subunit